MTTDAGDTWVELEKPAKETATAPDGGTTKLYPISFGTYNKNRHAIAIDPRSQHDPTLEGNLRLLMGGRKGIYEYDNSQSSGSKWSIYNTGLDGSLHYNHTEFTPWMGPVQFDPQQNGIVYSVQTSDRVSMSLWKDPAINNNCLYEGEGTLKPIYYSKDWGVTWQNLDDQSLPDMLTVPTIHVSNKGTLYAASANSGIYKFSETNALLSINDKVNELKPKVFPNPSKNEFTILMETNTLVNRQIIIYNVLGYEIERTEWKDNAKSINVTNYPPGVYFVNIEGVSKAEKIIIE